MLGTTTSAPAAELGCRQEAGAEKGRTQEAAGKEGCSEEEEEETDND